jgi:hypothetical protein
MIEANKVLIDAISAEIKVKNPSATTNELSDTSQKVADIFEKLNGGIMQLEDVTKEVVDFCLKMVDKSESLNAAKNSIVNSIDNILLSIDKLVSKLGSLDGAFSGINSPVNTIAKEFSKKNIASNNFRSDNRIIESLFDIVKKSINVTKNFIKNIFGNISSFINNVFTAITNPFKKIGSMLMAPFKMLDSFIKSPFKAISGVKDKISNKIGQAEDFLSGGLTGGPAKRDREDDYKIAGITSRALSTDLVLRRSAAGVAAVWLAKLLVGKDKVSENMKTGMWDIAKGNMISGFMTKLLPSILPFLTTWALPMLAPAIAAGAMYYYFKSPKGHASTGVTGGSEKGINADIKAIVEQSKRNQEKEKTKESNIRIQNKIETNEKKHGTTLNPFSATKAEASEQISKTVIENNKKISKSAGNLSLSLSTQSIAAIKSADTINQFNKNLNETNDRVLPSFWESISNFLFGKPSESPRGRGSGAGSGGGMPPKQQTTGSPKTVAEAKSVGPITIDPKLIGKNVSSDDVAAFISKSISEGKGKTATTKGKTNVEDVNNIRNDFMSTIKQKVTNPYALAAIEATVQRESAWKRDRMSGDWNDLGKASGGLMSWRGDRLSGLRGFAKKNQLSLDSAETQALYFMHEQKKNLDSLNAAKSPEDAARMMAEKWKFAGYKGGSELNARIAKTKEYVNKYAETSVAKSPQKPVTDITVAAKEAQETKRTTVSNQNDLLNKTVEQLTSLGKHMAKSVSIQEEQKQALTKQESPSNQVKVAGNPNEIPKYILEMIFGMNSGGENNRLGLL